MNKIEAHINRLFWDVPESGRKSQIMQEITQNLEEKVSDLISQGRTETEAVQKAIEDFGDIGEIQRELMGSAELMQQKNLGLSLAFSVWGCILTSALFIFINLYYTPGNIWFVYPLFAVLWWPMSLFFHWRHRISGESTAFPYSVASYVLIMALVFFINLYYTPHTIWLVYPAFAVVWWPVSTFFLRLRQKSRKDDIS
jgi:hypothetical protein